MKRRFWQRRSVSLLGMLLALGILEAKDYAAKVAGLLTAKDSWVRYHAAISLVFMKASEHGRRAVSIIRKTHKAGEYFIGEFHPLVKEETLEIEKRFRVSLAQMSSRRTTSVKKPR